MTVLSFAEFRSENEVFRFDPEYFAKKYLQKLDQLKEHGYRILDDLAYVTDGIHESIPYDEDGEVKIISAKHPKENYFVLSNLEFVTATFHSQNPRTALREKDVILSTVGTIGNCAVVEKHILPANSDRHVGIIRPNKISPYYLSTFFLSDYGRFQTDRETTGNVQPNLFISKLKTLKVAITSEDFIAAIEQTVKMAYSTRKSSLDLYAQAEQTLLTELGLLKWQPPEPLTYQRKASEVLRAGRLDAEHFQPKYEALLSLIGKRGGVRLGDQVKEPIRRGISPEYVEEGGDVIVINSRHVGKVQVEVEDNRYTTRELLNNQSEGRGEVITGDVLLNSTGYITIGRCQCLLENVSAVVDNHVAIIRPKPNLDPVYLACFLNAQSGQMQSERGWTGSSGQIELRPDVIANYLIWEAPISIQQQIRSMVEQSHSARHNAKHMLERAKRAVEIAIEESEAAALAYLDME